MDQSICSWNLLFPPPTHAGVYAHLRTARALHIAAQVLDQAPQLLHIAVHPLLSGKQAGKVLLCFAANSKTEEDHML
jgi:hypothetical protein